MLGLSPMNAIVVSDVPPHLLLGPSQIGITSHATHVCYVVLVLVLIAFQSRRIDHDIKCYSSMWDSLMLAPIIYTAHHWVLGTSFCVDVAVGITKAFQP